VIITGCSFKDSGSSRGRGGRMRRGEGGEEEKEEEREERESVDLLVTCRNCTLKRQPHTWTIKHSRRRAFA
jgi:hypothetical protein